MAIEGATSLQGVGPVTDAAVALNARLIENDITRFRFKFGGVFILAGLLVFFVGHLVPFAQYFTKDFPDHSWTVTKTMFWLGAAFSGKEVVESLISAAKATVGK